MGKYVFCEYKYCGHRVLPNDFRVIAMLFSDSDNGHVKRIGNYHPDCFLKLIGEPSLMGEGAIELEKASAEAAR